MGPLGWSCYMGHHELVAVLVGLGGDIEARANSGWVPLLLAVSDREYMS
jgi:hypothetical protein